MARFHFSGPRDVLLIAIGAFAMHISTLIFSSSNLLVLDTRVSFGGYPHDGPTSPNVGTVEQKQKQAPVVHQDDRIEAPPLVIPPAHVPAKALAPPDPFPHTTVLRHAPGWTVFENIYMANGTLFILSDEPRSAFPDITMMTSTGLPGFATEESIRDRIPTAREMDFVAPAEARSRWGKGDVPGVWTVEGNTLLFNDPGQFLDHYYHFCAELLLGTWSFWTGTFSANDTSLSRTAYPHIDRAIFAHADASGWRDGPTMNAYFLRAALPSIAVEVQRDWEDRALATSNGNRVWRFPTLLLADRSAAFRGEECGRWTQRTAAEAYEGVRRAGALQAGWWEPVRRAVLRFGGVEEKVVERAALFTLDPATAGAPHFAASMGLEEQALAIREDEKRMWAQDVVITYISRQAGKRHLIEADHAALVAALEELVTKKNAGGDERGRRWELNVVQAEKMSREAQLAVMGRTTILLGVHGNGLTHLILMPPTKISTVIEIFYPEGFSHDYEWTTRALGMKHFAVWYDKHMTYPNTPNVNYPEGFQGTQIPVHGETVAKLIESRAEGRL